MEYKIWLCWKPKGKDYPFSRTIKNAKELVPLLNEKSIFDIDGLGFLVVRKIRKYPSEMDSNLTYVQVDCKLVGGRVS